MFKNSWSSRRLDLHRSPYSADGIDHAYTPILGQPVKTKLKCGVITTYSSIIGTRGYNSTGLRF